MSERKKTPDILDQMLGESKPVKSESPVVNKNLKMKITPLRLPVSWRETLKMHFRSKGQDLSNGLRGIIAEYMNREGLK
ncbi:hypothetical protein ES702_03951 [subsurface metagenome]